MDASTSESPSGAPKLENEISLNNLPTEIFFILFEFVAPKDMIRCRQVCCRWRDIIDALLHDGSLWEKFCRRDYPKIYKQAMWKSPDIESWYELYRSLSLWSQLPDTKDTIDEFSHSDTINNEMRNAVVQERGLVMVHKRTRIVYHDLLSLEVAERKGFLGQYVSLVELEDVVIMLSINGDLHIVHKPEHNWHSDLVLNTSQDDKIVSNNVKSFIVENRTVFYSKYRHHEIYAFNIDNDSLSHLIQVEHLLEEVADGVAAIGFENGLNILTMSHNLYTYIDKKMELKFKLNTSTNLMDCIYQHNMLENLDWRHYYVLMTSLKQKRHTGLLQFISKVHVYGDLFLVGTQSGIVNIYYKPFDNGHLNLAQFSPIKSYNFSARIDIPILSVYPIINLNVVETKDGHIILVCMPRKILVISYMHDFKKTVCSKAVIPYVATPLSIE